MNLGLVGLGLLGTALAERFLAAGHTVYGFDISPDRRTALAGLGGIAAESAGFVAQSCQTLFLSLPNSDVVSAVVTELLPQLTADSLLVDTTTGDPDRTTELGANLARSGIEYVDATVAGSSEQARRGDVVVMTGGTAEALARCADLLATFSRQVFHVGPWGSGARMKLVVNLVLGLNRAVLAEGLSLAKAAGLDPTAALEVLKSGPAFSTVMETKGPKMLSGDFAPQARLAQHLKDVRLILELGERVGASLPLSTLHQTLLNRGVEMGLGDADNSAIAKVLEEWGVKSTAVSSTVLVRSESLEQL